MLPPPPAARRRVRNLRALRWLFHARHARRRLHGPGLLFNHALARRRREADVYDAVGRPVVESVCAGVNGAILAFGQTSSGKTHTIHGTHRRRASCRTRWRRSSTWWSAHGARSPYTFEVRMSFVEVYNERIYDLLSRCAQRGGLVDDYHATGKSIPLLVRPRPLLRLLSQVRLGSGHADEERCKRLTCPAGCSGALRRAPLVLGGLSVGARRRHRATATTGCGSARRRRRRCRPRRGERAPRRGEVARKVAATGMNANSSRSHAIPVCSLTQRNQSREVEGEPALLRRPRRLREPRQRGWPSRRDGSHQPLALLARSGHRRLLAGDRHVPYRDSKLTRLLQNALGGNARTSLIVTCSAEADCASETLSTLRFGARAAQVVTQPTVNEFETPAHLRAKLAEAQKTIGEQAKTIAALHRQVALLQRQLTLGLPGLTLGGGFGGGLGYDALERP